MAKLQFFTSWDDVPIIIDIPMAARILGSKPAYLMKLCRDGKFPAFKHGRFWRVRKEDLQEYINQNRIMV